MSPLSSITSINRFLAFSSGRRRESTSASRRLPHLRWDRCLGLARSVRFGFLGSTAKESAVVRFIPRAGLSAGAEALLHDAGAAVAILAGGYALVFGFNDLTRREVLQQNLSRKLVHMLSGLLFLASWPIFRELLRGPLYYVLMLMLCSLIFWRDSPVGVVSLAMMCGGDGVADIIGRRFGNVKIPYNKKKSLAGSISMLVFGSLISIGYVQASIFNKFTVH